MKKLLSSLIVACIVVFASANTSVAQEVKERAQAQLHVAKTQKLQRDVCKAFQKSDAQQNHKVINRPVRAKAQVRVQPADRRIEE